MRCGNVEPLVERYVDGVLDAPMAQDVERHVRTCGRCTARVAAARRLQAAFAAEPLVRAPRGFTSAVMDAVYREALAPQHAADGEGMERQGADGGRAAWGLSAFARTGARSPLPVLRMYRRLGLSFVLTAVVLTASLLIPRFSYPALLTEQGIGAGVGRGSAVIAQGTLENANQAMRVLMGGNTSGGGTSR
jgi:anti-sigma factor RsiW